MLLTASRIAARTYTFPVVLDQEDDGRWVAECPDLSGCVTWGYTKEQAIANAHEAATAVVLDMLAIGEAVPVVAPGERAFATVVV